MPRCAEAVVGEEESNLRRVSKYDTGSYTFLVDTCPYVSGDGMEHRNPTVIAGIRPLTRGFGGAADRIGRARVFHSWNVKRIRPRSLKPFDFERADMSGELWFAEDSRNTTDRWF